MKAKWMDDCEAILAHIIANPDDDAPRFVMSDWLEENGQAEWAALIRLQIEMAKIPACDHEGAMIIAPAHCRRCELRGEIAALDVGRRFPSTKNCFVCIDPPPLGWTGDVVFSEWATLARGFVEGFRCSLDTWMTDGPTLVRQHPIQWVGLTDKFPLHDTSINRPNGVTWFAISPVKYKNRHYTTQRDITRMRRWNCLPLEFLDPNFGAPEFDDNAEAHKWLSKRAIAWAKSAEPTTVKE